LEESTSADRPLADSPDSIDLARKIVETIEDRKGSNILVLDLRELSIMADLFVIASGNSDRQLNAIADNIREEVKKAYQVRPQRTEGRGEGGWVLMDYADVIVHLFSEQARAYYNLEDLWREAPVLLRVQGG
jgi:ribosome-associated protein